MADRADGLACAHALGRVGLDGWAAQVLLHSGRVTSGQHERVEGRRVDRGPGHRCAKLGRLLQLAVGGPGRSRRAKAAHDEAVEHDRVRRRRDAAVLGGDHHLVPGLAQELPGHCRLARIEIAVGQRHQDAHHGRTLRSPYMQRL